MSIFQPYVHPVAKDDLAQSDILTTGDKLEAKEKHLLHSFVGKDIKNISAREFSKLKDVTRKHVVSTVRVDLWMILSGGIGVKKTSPTLYQDTCKELFTQDGFIPDGLDEDGEFLTYYLTEEGGFKLRQVLCIIQHLHPDITFCPLLEPIVSILLHFMTDEDCFAVVSGLLSSKTNLFLTHTKADNIIIDACLQDLLKSLNIKAYDRIKSCVPSEENKGNKLVLFPNWRRMIFEQLDFVCLVRLLDCLMVEGSKILFRTGLYLLTAFNQYSFAFRKLDCTSPNELIATIGQHAHSLTLKPDPLIKDVLKIKITSKQMDKFNEENRKLYKVKQLEYLEDENVNIMIAIDVRQVSNIIKPKQWQLVCEWLPSRIQILQPHLLFSTEKDGYNLKRLYTLCEEEEQTLMIIRTSTNEIFGAYLSRSLIERHSGRQKLSYFGTGETFIFRLEPDSICYHWNQPPKQECHRNVRRKIGKYVFVDIKPLAAVNENSASVNIDRADSKLRRIRSLKRTLSFSVRGTKSNSRTQSYASLKLINIRRNASSVPRHLHVGGIAKPTVLHEENDIRRPLLQSAQTFDVAYRKGLHAMHNMGDAIDEGYEDFSIETQEKRRSLTGTDARPNLKRAQAVMGESFDVIEGNSSDKADSNRVVFFVGTGDAEPEKRMELFISCDDTNLIIGGGGGEAIWIDGDMENGRSARCNTFFNAPLTSNPNGNFSIVRVDVFGFQ